MDEILIAFLEEYLAGTGQQTTKITDDFTLFYGGTAPTTETFETVSSNVPTGWTKTQTPSTGSYGLNSAWKTQGTYSFKATDTGKQGTTAYLKIEKALDLRDVYAIVFDFSAVTGHAAYTAQAILSAGGVSKTYGRPASSAGTTTTPDNVFVLPAIVNASTSLGIEFYITETGGNSFSIDNMRFIMKKSAGVAVIASTGNLEEWKEINYTNTLGGVASVACHVCSLDIARGTAQAGAATTITLASTASAVDDYYNNKYIFLASGACAGQVRKITDYVGSTKVATVGAWTDYTPDTTSVYEVYTVLAENFTSGDASALLPTYSSVALLFVATRATTTDADTASLSALTATWKGGAGAVKSIQRGFTTISGVESLDVTISPVNPNKAIVSSSFVSYIDNVTYGTVAARIKDSTTLTVLKGSASSSGALSWEVVEYY